MKKSHRTSRAVFLFCFCCDARSMQATFGDLTNAKYDIEEDKLNDF